MKKISMSGLFSKLFSRNIVLSKNPAEMNNQKPLSVLNVLVDNLDDLTIKMRQNKKNQIDVIRNWYDENKVENIFLYVDEKRLRFRKGEHWYYNGFLTIDLSDFPTVEMGKPDELYQRDFCRYFLKSGVMDLVYEAYEKDQKGFKEVMELAAQTRMELNKRLEDLYPKLVKVLLTSGSVWEGEITFETAREYISADKVVITKVNTMTSNVEVWKDGECIYRNPRISNDLMLNSMMFYVKLNLKKFEQYEL